MTIENEFSRPLHIDRMAEYAKDLALSANAEECKAVARRLDLLTLSRLSAAIRVERRDGGQLVFLTGRIDASCEQECVVTMQPVEAHVEAAIERCFQLGGQAPGDKAAPDNEIVVDERDDEPEPLNGPVLDLGEVVVEEFSLALDTYPRAADVPVADPAPAESDRTRPFAALASLRDGRNRVSKVT